MDTLQNGPALRVLNSHLIDFSAPGMDGAWYTLCPCAVSSLRPPLHLVNSCPSVPAATSALEERSCLPRAIVFCYPGSQGGGRVPVALPQLQQQAYVCGSLLSARLPWCPGGSMGTGLLPIVLTIRPTVAGTGSV